MSTRSGSRIGELNFQPGGRLQTRTEMALTRRSGSELGRKRLSRAIRARAVGIPVIATRSGTRGRPPSAWGAQEETRARCTATSGRARGSRRTGPWRTEASCSATRPPSRRCSIACYTTPTSSSADRGAGAQNSPRTCTNRRPRGKQRHVLDTPSDWPVLRRPPRIRSTGAGEGCRTTAAGSPRLRLAPRLLHRRDRPQHREDRRLELAGQARPYLDDADELGIRRTLSHPLAPSRRRRHSSGLLGNLLRVEEVASQLLAVQHLRR